MKLSIIIPAYNIEKTIAYCLDSILSQPEVFEYEVVVVDDGSTDGTVALVEAIAGSIDCQPFSESDLAAKLPVSTRIFHEKGLPYERRTRSRIRFLRQPQNMGVSAARNCGIETACGEYIWFVDGDDFIALDALSSLFEILEREKMDILQFQFQTFWATPLDFSLPTALPNLRIWNLANFRHLKNAIKPDRMGYIWRTIVRKDVIGDIRFDTRYTHDEDGLFSVDIFLAAQTMGIVNTVLYGYVRRQDSAMGTNSLKKLSSFLGVNGEMIVSVEKSSRSDKEKALLTRRFQKRAHKRFFLMSSETKASSHEIWEKWFEIYPEIMLKPKYSPTWRRAISKILWRLHSPFVFMPIGEFYKIPTYFEKLFYLLMCSHSKRMEWISKKLQRKGSKAC